jgi:serine phosphatase RsbU (regulator of sigma subunit)
MPGATARRSDPDDALASAAAAVARATLLAEATSELATSLDVAGSLRRLAGLVVPTLADWVIIDLADDDGRPVQVAMLHRDGMDDVIRRFSALQPHTMTREAPIMRILAGEPAILVPHAMTRKATAYVSDMELLELCDVLGICSAMYVPLRARDRVLGSIALVSGRSGRIYDEDDLEFAVDLARRAALVVDNTSLYEREHRVAQVLQESLLPKLPDVAGFELAASYLPGERGAAVGGDFYEVLVLPDGSTAFAVGDVAGHDIAAAATMGQLRGLLRACAWEPGVHGGEDPGVVLQRLDRLVQAFDVTSLATVFYARAVDGEHGRPRAMHYATAGHPAPLLRLPDGRVVELDEAPGFVLGLDAGRERSSACVDIPAGSILVAFTDGLIERRGEHWDSGLERVRGVLADAPADIGAAELAERLSVANGDGLTDDVAILVARAC